jgi:hypothetical protein
MIIATFGPNTGWAGKLITREGDVFTLEDHGPISAIDVMEYDRQGQLVWANDGTRAWVGSRAAIAPSPQGKATVGPQATPRGNEDTADDEDTGESAMVQANSYAQIPPKARKIYDANHGPANIEFVIVGNSSQCLVALSQSCIIVKPGFMAGATGGGRFTEFHYADITGIEVNTGMINAVLEVTTPAYQGRSKDFWSAGKNEDPFKVSNCLPGSKALFCQGEGAARIEELRNRVRQAKQHARSPAPTPAVDPAEQIRKLAELRDTGILTEAEFAEAKARIIGAL